ncbi:MAG: DinB family protein [Anaerolineae bacterium]|nr:DinB family protein [Anaerolineae bacterium]
METILTHAYAVLANTPARWQVLIEKLPPELLTQPPAPGEWSALDCLQHLIDTERWVFAQRIEAILAGRDFPAFDPDSQDEKPDAGQSPADMVETFSRLRTINLPLFQKITPADLERQARHSELGLVTMSQLLHHWTSHDLMHTVQAERALMQPFIQGCGPWQSYFSDHFVTTA